MAIDVSYFEYKSTKIDRSYRIVHLSDYHSNSRIKVAEKVKDLCPDLIVFTGDLIDRRRYDLEKGMELISELTKICSIYYVSGNHEAWSNHYPEIKEALLKEGVFVLEDNCLTCDDLNICGIKDIGFDSPEGYASVITENKKQVLKTGINENKLNILLAHRPEHFKLYSEYDYDLVFSGHAHGGQFRFFNRGLYAPHQGVMPEYSGGQYKNDSTTLILSRGLGNSRFPIRLFNNFEIVVVDLMEDKDVNNT